MVEKKKPDIGKRGVGGADYFQPSTGKTITREQYIAGGQPRTYTVNQMKDLTKEEYEKIKRTPELMYKTLESPESKRKFRESYTKRDVPLPLPPKIQEEEALKTASIVQPGEELSAELGEKIGEPPELLGGEEQIAQQPSTIDVFLEGVGRAGDLSILKALKGDQMSSEEAKLKGIAKLGVGAAALGFLLGSPLLAKFSATSTATKSMAAKLGIFSSVIGGLSAYFIGRQVTDYRGGELDTMREMIGSFTEDGERLQALATQGADPSEILSTLQDMSEEIDNAEATIKDIGIKNIQFRYEKEYLRDMQKIRSARLAIRRRVEAVINIVQTGQASLDAGSLIYTASGFK